MKINVGTKNGAKIRAVESALSQYDIFSDVEIIPVEVSTGVADQPLTMKETVEGAKNRARKAFMECDYSVGLENGLIEVPGSANGRMDICCCAIFDGKRFSLGLSSGFELPKILQKFVDQGSNMSDAAIKAGLTSDPKIAENGVISILSKGRIKRGDYIKEAVMMAFIQIESHDIYAKA